jgi:hypothetical protein
MAYKEDKRAALIAAAMFYKGHNPEGVLIMAERFSWWLDPHLKPKESSQEYIDNGTVDEERAGF